jgi:hypothetical protein
MFNENDFFERNIPTLNETLIESMVKMNGECWRRWKM